MSISTRTQMLVAALLTLAVGAARGTFTTATDAAVAPHPGAAAAALAVLADAGSRPTAPLVVRDDGSDSGDEGDGEDDGGEDDTSGEG